MSSLSGTIGINITPEEICKYCDRMQLGPATYLPESDTIQVFVPPTRSDILHAVDVIEDVAIAFGYILTFIADFYQFCQFCQFCHFLPFIRYNNIVQSVPHTLTVGCPLPINQFTDLLRAEIARAGYVEMLTHPNPHPHKTQNLTVIRTLPLIPNLTLTPYLNSLS